MNDFTSIIYFFQAIAVPVFFVVLFIYFIASNILLFMVGILQSKINEIYPGKFDFTYSKRVKEHQYSRFNSPFSSWNKMQNWFFPEVDFSTINDLTIQQKYSSLKNTYKVLNFFSSISLILMIIFILSILKNIFI